MLTKKLTPPFIGIRINGQFAIVNSQRYRAARESIAQLGGPEEVATVGDKVWVSGPRSHYHLQNHHRADWKRTSQYYDVASANFKWAEAERTRRRRKADPTFRAIERAKKITQDRAAFWAIDRGFRGCNDAARKLKLKVGHARQWYESGLDRYREARLPEPEEPCTSYAPEPPKPQDWVTAKRRAHLAGRELARCLAEGIGQDDFRHQEGRPYIKPNGRTGHIYGHPVGVYAYTKLRKRFEPILGVDLPPFSKLSKYAKIKVQEDAGPKALLTDHIQRNTRTYQFERYDFDGGETIAHILKRRKDWIAAVSLLEEFETILRTGELPEGFECKAEEGGCDANR